MDGYENEVELREQEAKRKRVVEAEHKWLQARGGEGNEGVQEGRSGACVMPSSTPTHTRLTPLPPSLHPLQELEARAFGSSPGSSGADGDKPASRGGFMSIQSMIDPIIGNLQV